MNDLEYLREMFKDTRLHIGIGTIVSMGLSLDQSTFRVLVNLLPENRKVVATMCFNDVNDVTYPEANDLVLLALVDGDVEEVHVIKTINSTEEKVPLFAQNGSSVRYARPGKKLYLGSDTKVGIGRPNVEPTEPLALGNTLVAALNAFANALLNAAQIGQSAMGPVVLDPTVRTALVQFQSTYLSTAETNIVSQIAFTERGI